MTIRRQEVVEKVAATQHQVEKEQTLIKKYQTQGINKAFKEAAQDYSNFLECVELIECDGGEAEYSIILAQETKNSRLYHSFNTLSNDPATQRELSIIAEQIEEMDSFKAYKAPITQSGYNVSVEEIHGPRMLPASNQTRYLRLSVSKL